MVNMEDKLSKSYILITAVKNEEIYLPKLIQSIVNQSVRPKLWVIVDDGSTDRTPELIKDAKKMHEWIQSIRLEESVRDRGAHLANVIRRGIDFAYKYCKRSGIRFEYIGIIDADVVPEHTYFENLLKKFENNGKLGVASGGEWFINGGKITYYKGRYPSGGDVLYRRECYEDCGGVPLTVLWDSVLNTKAKLRGWEVKRFDDCKAFVMRGYCYADGLWKGYKKVGESSYVMNYNIFCATIKGLILLFVNPYYIGFAFLYGYFKNLILHKEQINDKEIKYYFRHIRPREIKQYYFDILKNKLKWRKRYK